MKRFISIITLFLVFPLLNAEEENSKLNGLCDPTSYINGYVNGVYGSFVYSFPDITVDGPEPINFARNYCSSTRSQERFGWGFRDNHPTKMRAFYNCDPRTMIQTSGGDMLDFYGNKTKGTSWQYLYLGSIGEGFTNTGCGDLSGKTNIKNTKIEYIPHANKKLAGKTVVHAGDGSKKYFINDLLITYERHPSGNLTHYSYTESGRLSRIYTTDETSQTVFGWMDIHYENDASGDNKYVNITASNGKKIRYHMRKEIVCNYPRYLLTTVTGTGIPETKYGYSKKNTHINRDIDCTDHFLSKIGGSGSNSFCLDYGDAMVKKISKSFPNGKDVSLYKITYEGDHCTVKDPYDGKLSYKFSDDLRIKEFRRYLNNELYNKNVFFWAKGKSGKIGEPIVSEVGNLISKGITDKDGNILGLIHYTYDTRGNVLKETLAGHLTANKPPKAITVKHGQPIYNGAETYAVTYTYSNDGFNNKLSQTEQDGTHIKYTYLPDTDKLIKKLTCINQDVIQREFFEYDNFKILTSHIFDDGSSDDINDLSNITKRIITTIIPNKSPGTPGFGKPLSVIEKYWDMESQSERQLKRIDYTYGIYDLMVREDYFDANNQYSHSICYAYDDQGNCIEKIDEEGYTTWLTYDKRNNCISSEKLGSNVSTRFSYNGDNKPTKTEEIHASGECFVSHIEYDLLERKILERDPFGNETKYKYDSLGRLIETIKPIVEGPDGGLVTPVLKQGYNIWDQVVKEVDPAGYKLEKGYNCRGQIALKKFPDGTTETFTYNLNGTLHKKILKNGTYSVLSYDQRKNLISEDTFSESGEFLRGTKFCYHGSNLASAIDSMGNIVEYKYDGAGRKIEEIQLSETGSYHQQFVYDSFGRLAEHIKWNDSSLNDCQIDVKYYDVLNRVIEEQIKDGNGNIHSRKTKKYDINGNCVEEVEYISENKLSIIFKEFTSYNLPLLVVDPLGHKTHYTYDFNHKNEHNQTVLKTTVTDPNGIQTITIKDTHNRDVVIQRKNCLSNLLSSERIYYDLRGLKTKHECDVLDQEICIRKYIVSWTHDSMGRPIAVIEDPGKSNKHTAFTYDNLGSIATKIKPDGTQLTYLYDTLGREISIKSSDKSIDCSFQYDLNDHMIESTDNITNTKLFRKYDVFGNLIEEALPNNCRIKIGYDHLKRITHVDLPDDSQIVYKYGPVEMISVSKVSPDGTVLYTHRYDETDWGGRSLSSILVSGEKIDFKWDLKGRFLSMQSSHISQEVPEDGYDPAGNIVKINYSGQHGILNEEYQYDQLNQLVHENGIKTHRYKYDSLNNRLSKDQNTYSLNRLNQVESDGPNTYTYDKNGNIIAQTSPDANIQYTYDAMNRLKSICKEREWMIESAYDTYNRRISSTRYEWDGEWKKVNQSNYFYLGIHELGSRDSEDHITQLRILGKRDGPILRVAVAVEIDQQIYAPIYDHRFNVISLVDIQNNQVAESYRYTAFGEVTVFDENGNKSESSKIGNPWLFSNKRYDAESDLYYFGNRYYRPSLGRWLTTDPADFVDGMNLYAYTHNRAMNCIDYFGFNTQDLNPTENRLMSTIRTISHHVSHMVNKIGKFIETISHHALPVGPLQYIGESIGLLLQGKSIIHSYAGANGTRIGNVGIKSLFRAVVMFGNGICTTVQECMEVAQQISGELDGAHVRYVCVVEKGGLTDAVIATFETCGITNNSIKHVASEIMKNYNLLKEVYGDDFTIYYIAHSRGGLELYLAASYLPQEVRNHIEAYTLGSAKLIPMTTFKKGVNYANEKDCVHKLAKFLNTEPDVNIQYTGYRSNSMTSFIDDHFIKSEGYQKAITNICDKIKSDQRPQ